MTGKARRRWWWRFWVTAAVLSAVGSVAAAPADPMAPLSPDPVAQQRCVSEVPASTPVRSYLRSDAVRDSCAFRAAVGPKVAAVVVVAREDGSLITAYPVGAV